MSEKKVILVTGGTGLVGSAIRHIVENEDKREDETFIFISSKDADLTLVKFSSFKIFALKGKKQSFDSI